MNYVLLQLLLSSGNRKYSAGVPAQPAKRALTFRLVPNAMGPSPTCSASYM